MRFHVLNAEWMPDEVKQRLNEQQANRINNMGELLVTSQEHRLVAFPFGFYNHAAIELLASFYETCLIKSTQSFIRTQSNNREHCIEKLKVMVAQAYIVPKERNMYEGISKGAKIERKVEKRARGVVKSSRRSNNVKDFDD